MDEATKRIVSTCREAWAELMQGAVDDGISTAEQRQQILDMWDNN